LEKQPMLSELNRRDLLFAGGAAFLGASAMGRALAASQAETKKVLFFIKSAGYPHSVVTRRGDQLSLAEGVLRQIGDENGFQIISTKDGRVFEPDVIQQFDAFVFETTGDLTSQGTTEKSPPISPEGEKALYEAIRAGKGFLGMHCATDTFGHHAP